MCDWLEANQPCVTSLKQWSKSALSGWPVEIMGIEFYQTAAQKSDCNDLYDSQCVEAIMSLGAVLWLSAISTFWSPQK